jgi:single-strand selective monofunctional uracil DNA glycosylase
MKNLFQIADDLVEAVATLQFSHPVAHVYNTLTYARSAYDEYLRRYGKKPKKVILLGMNLGPWGMVQTGIPFGEVLAVKEWLGMPAHHGVPETIHSKRPVAGFL